MTEFEGKFSLRKGRKMWLKEGLISADPISDGELHVIPDHIVFIYRDEQNRRCTRFVADVVIGPEAFETAERMVDAANQQLWPVKDAQK